MAKESTLQKEIQFFQKNKPEYLKLYKDQYVLIKDDKFTGAYTTDAQAYKSGLEQFGNQPFLIKQVLEDDAQFSYPALTVGAININP